MAVESPARAGGPAPNAIVLLANYLQAPPGWRQSFGWVGSRMLLWCLSGRGEITVNGRHGELGAGQFLFIPWGHAISYATGDYQPYLLGGIHVVPDHSPDVEPEYRIVHTQSGPPPERPERRDAELPGLAETLAGRLDDVPGLAQLADYVVKWYVGRRREEPVARALGRVLLAEMVAAARTPEAASVTLPARLRRVMDHVRRNLVRAMAVEDLAALAECSPATLSRLFRRHLRMTPIGWVIRQRVERARELLVSTQMPVGEIGAAVGVEDPFYFSKLFRKATGHTASDFRRRNSLV
jgi:AraC-like DNA-binding protein